MTRENILAKLMPQDAKSLAILDARAKTLADVSSKKIITHKNDISYITFILANNEKYGIPHQDIEEVNYLAAITKVPKSPEFVAGIINWHGKFIPVINLGIYFGIGQSQELIDQKILVAIKHDKLIIAFVFDNVSGVDHYALDSIDKNLIVNSQIKDSYIQGIHKGNTAILNIKNIIADVSLALANQKEISHE